MDYGDILLQLIDWMVNDFWTIPLTMFGMSITIGTLTAWIVISGIVIWFVKGLVGIGE